MISRLSPAAARTAATAASPAAGSRRSIRSLTARNPASCAASAASARACGARASPNDAYAGIRAAAPPNSAATGCPAAWPMMSHSAASSGQYRPAWKLMVSRTRTCLAICRGSWPTNRSAYVSKPSIVSPEPYPVRPSSVSTRTSVASNQRRGTGSQAARNGGSRGRRSRSSRIAVIFTRTPPVLPERATRPGRNRAGQAILPCRGGPGQTTRPRPYMVANLHRCVH